MLTHAAERLALTDIETRIAEAVAARARPGVDVSADTVIFDGGLALDSIQFLELILEIEELTGTILADESLDEDAARTVGSLQAHVLKKLLA